MNGERVLNIIDWAEWADIWRIKILEVFMFIARNWYEFEFQMNTIIYYLGWPGSEKIMKTHRARMSFAFIDMVVVMPIFSLARLPRPRSLGLANLHTISKQFFLLCNFVLEHLEALTPNTPKP